MEFFRIIKFKTTENILQNQVTLSHIDKISTEIFNLNDPSENEANIGGIWGEFTLSRIKIKGGIRFSLIECPNALCWTITTGYPPEPDSIIVYLTINRQEKNIDFIEEVEDFLDDMCANLTHFFSTSIAD